VREDEHRAEIATYRDLLQRSTAKNRELQSRIVDLTMDQKRLKGQNLSLQYHLNLWGVPVLSGEDAKASLEKELSRAFFPRVQPLAGNPDPIPVVLHGDLRAFSFPDLIHFLGNSNLLGVLSVVTDGMVSKLYVRKGVVRLAGWNRRESDSGEVRSLLSTLRASGGVAEEDLVDYEGLPLYDLEVAKLLLREKGVPASDLQAGLKDHARTILGHLFHLRRGAFSFQEAQVEGVDEILFHLPIIDLLLKAAADADERTRAIVSTPGAWRPA
jgi:hypothetical protein